MEVVPKLAHIICVLAVLQSYLFPHTCVGGPQEKWCTANANTAIGHFEERFLVLGHGSGALVSLEGVQRCKFMVLYGIAWSALYGHH